MEKLKQFSYDIHAIEAPRGLSRNRQPYYEAAKWIAFRWRKKNRSTQGGDKRLTKTYYGFRNILRNYRVLAATDII